MPDIKLDAQNEKPAPPQEQTSVGGGKLKQSLERFDATDKAKNLEQARTRVIREISQANKAAPAAVLPVASLSAPQVKLQKQVENILSDGMADIYLSLAPSQRREFKIAGEDTAKKIGLLLTKAKINIGDIIKLIIKWLSIIPGVNKYFLEQEAKIKADEIIKIKR